MSGEDKALRHEAGAGPRPDCPYQRIVWAAKRGQGCTIAAEEAWLMSFDDAISARATAVALGMTLDATAQAGER